jgi:sugar transferase (PEP-CTERM/EpsH1 system associated)
LKILIITPRIPYPPYRGDKLKIFNISKILLKNNTIHIITFYRNDQDNELVKPLEEMGIKITLIKLTLINSLINALIATVQNTPFQVAWYKSKKMQKSVDSLLKDNNFDIVYYHLIRSAQYYSHNIVNPYLNVIDFTDAVSLYLSRMVKQERNFFKKLFIRSELKRINNYEKIAEKFDVLFICSEIDKKFLIDKGIKQDIQILNNGIDTDYFFSEKKDYDRKRIIFTGNMPYYANADAALYFAKEIFPLVIKKDPEVKFYIVGQQPSISIRQLASDNIFITGYVKDIKAEYLKSAVNIAPMRFGAGTLNKVLESIALGVPVVATSISMLGLPKELTKFVFIADSPEQFASTVLEIINNTSIRSELMNEGKEIISRMLSWNNIVRDFELFLEKKIKQKMTES